MNNHPLVNNPQKTLALAFGYKEPRASPSNNIQLVKQNAELMCKCCGRVQDTGFIDPKNSLIGAGTNAFYSYADVTKPFMCVYCLHNYSNYMKKMQKGEVYGDMAGLVLYHDGSLEHLSFLSSDDENALLSIFLNPPTIPFAILAKEYVGNVFIEMGYSYKPTVDKELIVVNIGNTTYYCDRLHTLEALKESEAILGNAKKLKLNCSDDVLFNGGGRYGYQNYLSHNLRANPEFMQMYREFMDKYSRDVRVVAKTMQRAYRKHIKTKGECLVA